MKNQENEFATHASRSAANEEKYSSEFEFGITPPSFQLKSNQSDQSPLIASMSNQPVAQRKASAEKDESEEKMAQMKALKGLDFTSGAEDSSSSDDSNTNNIPSNVNIHTDSSKASQLKAKAFTKGNDIHFAPGQYKPESKAGQKLIGHELKHVEQQAEGRVAPTTQLKGENINDDSKLEKEADVAGEAYAMGNWRPANVSASSKGITQRKPKANTKKVNLEDYQPSALIFITGLIFVIPENVKFKQGPKAPQAVSAVLNSLVGVGHGNKLRGEFLSYLNKNGLIFKGFENEAENGQSVGLIRSRSLPAVQILKFLEEEKNLEVRLSKNEKQLLHDGLSADKAWYAYSRSLGKKKGNKRISMGDFYFEMNQRRGALRNLDATHKNKKINDETKHRKTQSFLKNVAAEINFNKDLLAHLKSIPSLKKHSMYERLFGLSSAKTSKTEPHHQQAQSNFASFRYTEEKLTAEIMRNRAQSDGKKERQLLNRFKEYEFEIGKTKNKNKQVLLEPSKYNARALPATIKSIPDIRSPKTAVVDAKVSAYMSLAHQNTYDAMNYRYSYEWYQIPIKKSKAKNKKAKNKKSGTDGLSDVQIVKKNKNKSDATDMNLNNTYSAFQKTSDNWKEDSFKMFSDDTVGSLALGASFFTLAQVNTVLSYIGNLASFGNAISGPQVTQDLTLRKPGNYVLACVATPLTGDKRIKRPPSLALMPIKADHPKKIAFKSLNTLLKKQKSDKKSIAIYKKLIEKQKKLDAASHQKSTKQIKKSGKKSIDSAKKPKNKKLQEYTDRKNLLEAKQQSNYKYLSVLREQLKRKIVKEKHPFKKTLHQTSLNILEERLAMYKSRVVANVNGFAKAEKIDAVFVGRDSGQTMNLTIDAVPEADPPKGMHKYYISDVTSNKSGFGKGEGETKKKAIIRGLKNLLESTYGYGRGSLSAKVDGDIVQLNIEKSVGSIALDSAHNLSTVLNLAGLAAIPFSGGASMVLLGVSGAIGAATSSIKIYNRHEASTLRFDKDSVTDVIGLLGSTAGISQSTLSSLNLVVRSNRIRKLANGSQIVGGISDGLTALMINAELMSSMLAIHNGPIELRGKKAFAAISKAFLDAGMMAGAKLAHRYGAHFNKKNVGPAKLDSNFKHGSSDFFPKSKNDPSLKSQPPKPFKDLSTDRSSPVFLYQKIALSNKSGSPLAKKKLNSSIGDNSIVSRKILDPIHAHSIYLGAIDVSAGRHVGLFRSFKTGEYSIIMGSKTGIRRPVEFKRTSRRVLMHSPKNQSKTVKDNKSTSHAAKSDKPVSKGVQNKMQSLTGKDDLAPLQVKPTKQDLKSKRDPDDPNNPEYLWKRLGDPKFKYPVNNETRSGNRKYPDNSEFAGQLTDSRLAYRQYEMALAYADGREVAIFYNLKSKIYRVVIGDMKLSVSGRTGEITVLHTHPNKHSSKFGYFPSSPDFDGLINQFKKTGLKQRNIVESIIGDGTRVRTEFGIEPGITRGRFYVKYFDHETKSYVKRQFTSLNELEHVRARGTTYVEPGSLIHKSFMPQMNIKGYNFDKKTLKYTANSPLAKYMPQITYDKRTFRVIAKDDRGNLLVDRSFNMASQVDHFIDKFYLPNLDPKTLRFSPSNPYSLMTPNLPFASTANHAKNMSTSKNSSKDGIPKNQMSDDTLPNIKSPFTQSNSPQKINQAPQSQGQSRNSGLVPMPSGHKKATLPAQTTNPSVPIHNVQKIFSKATNAPGTPKSASIQQPKQNVNYDVKIFGDVPKNSVVHYSDPLWVIYTNATGQHRIRFDARSAVIAGEATKTSNFSTDDSAGVTSQGLPFVFEGRHRTIGAAHGQNIGIDVGGVAGKKHILDYEYVSEKTPTKVVRAIDQAEPKITPLTKKEADLKRQQYEDQIIKDLLSGKIKPVDPSPNTQMLQTPNQVTSITGYAMQGGTWVKTRADFPDISYDPNTKAFSVILEYKATGQKELRHYKSPQEMDKFVKSFLIPNLHRLKINP